MNAGSITRAVDAIILLTIAAYLICVIAAAREWSVRSNFIAITLRVLMTVAIVLDIILAVLCGGYIILMSGWTNGTPTASAPLPLPTPGLVCWLAALVTMRLVLRHRPRLLAV